MKYFFAFGMTHPERVRYLRSRLSSGALDDDHYAVLNLYKQSMLRQAQSSDPAPVLRRGEPLFGIRHSCWKNRSEGQQWVACCVLTRFAELQSLRELRFDTSDEGAQAMGFINGARSFASPRLRPQLSETSPLSPSQTREEVAVVLVFCYEGVLL
ncbi:hypothetical protein EVAR_92951_1 [Eumeta japonica]|uniref:Uncharacterized protein n=1 Tax=Eumeta variegata TaxID=151549 RepID=A0A4C1TBE0_EUMVA|nr:hypothetical protein EVAR_92951_1 [Eumeta japonica]